MYHKLNQYDVTLETYNKITENLSNFKSDIEKITAFLGFDGYIDSLYSLVEHRIDSKEWRRMESMKTFGDLLINISGSSGSIERVLKKRIFGGFAPNTSRAMSTLGAHTYLVGALGVPKLNQFYERQINEKIYSITEPGETLGLEFDDGKIMITDFAPILSIDWRKLTQSISIEKMGALLDNSKILGFGHWALVPNLNEIWRHFIFDIFPSLNNLESKLFFVDIADIRKRKSSDIKDLIKVLQEVETFMPVMLSVNDQEASLISKNLDNVKIIDPHNPGFVDYIEGGLNLNKEINISYFVIHSPHFATISTKNEHYWITEGFTSKPKYTVGAGDHFHTGVALGLSCNFSPMESILIGNALTAIFVRTGISPNYNQLKDFIFRYLDYINEDNPHFS
jgi:sugar/nucleoside kinase (ribokinase family)